MKACHKEMLAKLDACLGKPETWLGDLKATVLEATQEEVETKVEQQEVFNENMMEEIIGASV
jgi:hypothetical protein